ncbi:MAG: FecR domain-containing protein, partial [Bacteroidota bacterium]|nr:FecR domain-containing protein [Bacteroidota bacterium]
MKDKEYIENLIVRFLNETCTLKEIQELKLWVDKSPANKKEYLAVKDVWDITRQPKSNTEDQLALFYKNQYEKVRNSRRLWIRYSSAVATILLIGLLISILIPQNLQQLPETTQVFSVPLGSRSKVLLADGTEVSLNSGSELKYSSGFSSLNRVVSLSGEGFFHVKSDTKHPFLVKTTDFDVKVTGTQFNVNTYTENKFSSAALAEGKIQIKMNGSNQTFDINPSEKFDFNRSTRKYVLENADIESEIAWKDGKFIFKQIP